MGIISIVKNTMGEYCELWQYELKCKVYTFTTTAVAYLANLLTA